MYFLAELNTLCRLCSLKNTNYTFRVKVILLYSTLLFNAASMSEKNIINVYTDAMYKTNFIKQKHFITHFIKQKSNKTLLTDFKLTLFDSFLNLYMRTGHGECYVTR